MLKELGSLGAAPRFWSGCRQGCSIEERALFLQPGCVSTPGPGSPSPAFLLLQVGEVYRQLHTAMSQAPVKENIPYSWASLACVKAHHYGALAHYFVATLLIDHQRKACGLGGSGALVRVVLPEHSELSESCLSALEMLPGFRGSPFLLWRKRGSIILPGMEQTAPRR